MSHHPRIVPELHEQLIPERTRHLQGLARKAVQLAGSKSAAAEIELSRKRLTPVSTQGWSAACGQSRLLSEGSRTSTASACQSPAAPSLISRNLSGPNAQEPRDLAGLSVTTATLEFLQSDRAPATVKDREHRPRLPLPLSVNVGGYCARSENVSRRSCGGTPLIRMALQWRPTAPICRSGSRSGAAHRWRHLPRRRARP